MRLWIVWAGPVFATVTFSTKNYVIFFFFAWDSDFCLLTNWRKIYSVNIGKVVSFLSDFLLLVIKISFWFDVESQCLWLIWPQKIIDLIQTDETSSEI